MAGFSNPLWLAGLLVLPLIGYLFVIATRKKKKEAMEFSRVSFVRLARGNSANHRYELLFLLTLLTFSLLLLGLADPHIPLEQTKEGANVVLVIDISGSMQATDYSPTRIDSAKHAAGLLIDQLDPKDYVGIVTFESGAMSAAYLSPDKERVRGRLEAIQARTGPTALGEGLALGIDMADAIPNRKKVVILLSDGVNNAGIISPAEATAFSREREVQIFSTGLGSSQSVPAGQNLAGETLYAGLDEETLKTIAADTGGEYYKSVDDRTLAGIYSGLSTVIRREKEETGIGIYFIFGALVVILVEIFLRYGRGRILP